MASVRARAFKNASVRWRPDTLPLAIVRSLTKPSPAGIRLYESETCLKQPRQERGRDRSLEQRRHVADTDALEDGLTVAPPRSHERA
jgi:hypothetical protein